eukprot:306306-Rhodomonas_salina.4
MSRTCLLLHLLAHCACDQHNASHDLHFRRNNTDLTPHIPIRYTPGPCYLPRRREPSVRGWRAA